MAAPRIITYAEWTREFPQADYAAQSAWRESVDFCSDPRLSVFLAPSPTRILSTVSVSDHWPCRWWGRRRERFL